MTQLRPLHDRVVVQRTEEPEQMHGGLYIPDTAKEKPQQGRVMAVGDGQVLADGKRVPLDVKAGDLVLFGKYAGTEIIIEEGDFLILRENEILGILEGAKKTRSAKG